jgi:integrase
MLALTFEHGLRVSEVLALTRDNVVDGYLIVERKKGSLRTKQPLYHGENELLSIRGALEGFALRTLKTKRLFPISQPTAWRRIQHYGKLAGIPAHKLHMHALKHSCAMQLIDSAGIHRTQAWLGHKSMASTGAYLKPSDDDVAAAARKALDG